MDNTNSQKCRSCLEQGCTLKPLSGLSIASENALHLSDVFMMCAAIQISPNDGFSQYACIHCINSAEKAYLFKKQCEHSDKIWNEFKWRLQKDSISNLVEVLPSNDNAEITVPLPAPIKDECEADDYQADNDPMTETGSIEIDDEMDNDLDIKSIEIYEEPKTENFTCKYCLTIFLDEAKLLMHELAHSIEPKELAVKKYVIYDCQECSVDVKTAEEFVEHCHKLHENSIEKLYYRCKLCTEDFDNLPQFTAHISNKHKALHSPQLVKVSKKKFECPMCHKEYKTRNSLQAHIGNVHGVKLPKYPIEPKDLAVKKHVIYGCQECSFVVQTAEEFMQHCHKLHENSIEKLYYRCKLCAGDFDNLPKFTAHVSNRHKTLHSPQLTNASKKKFECQVCHNEYEVRNSLRRHIQKQHSGQLPTARYPIEPKELTVKKYVIYGCRECSVDCKTAEKFMEHCHKLHENSTEKLYYRCKLCAADFANLPQFATHVSKRHSPHLTNVSKKIFECQVCHNEYKNRETLRGHMRKVHDAKLPIEPTELAVKKYVIYGCRECSIDVTKAREFMKHCQKLHENSIEKLYYRCKLCAKDFDNLPQFTAHFSKKHKGIRSPHFTNVSKKEFECQVCHNEFKLRDSLRRHIRKHHPGAQLPESEIKSPGWPQSCKYCAFSLKSFKDKLTHFDQEHSDLKIFSCYKCKKTFFEKYHLRLHVEIHDKIKRHMCQYCGRRFANHSNLIMHIRIHTGEKRFKCDKCDECFVQWATLHSHKLTHAEEKNFECKECHKRFLRSGTLRKHMATHNDGPRHPCHLCPKLLKDSNSLKRHLSIHSGEKYCVCKVCGKGFNSRSNLQQHMVTHTGEKRHVCTICNKGFSQAHCLRSHNAKFHVDEPSS